MALKGTIKDFGIADIFQLIGHQAKTGELILRDEVDEVRVFFDNGSVKHAESTTRPTGMLLGSMLVNADVITAEQLNEALSVQKRTLKKLGTVLIELGYATSQVIEEFAQLQMSETVYRLFAWSSGTYEFEQTDGSAIALEGTPIRAETILMEGLRMVDEWPAIRRRLPNYLVTVERVRILRDDADANETGVQGAIEANERHVYHLIGDGQKVQKLIHLSRLGEFETCRSILALQAAGYVRLVDRGSGTGDLDPALQIRQRTRVHRTVAYAVLSMLTLLLVYVVDVAPRFLPSHAHVGHYEHTAIERQIAPTAMRVIARAVETYRAAHGSYPVHLDELTSASLLRKSDLTFPFCTPYYYRADGDSYILLPPLH